MTEVTDILLIIRLT